MARIISICNQKGGVGKTTAAINVSACLAEMGRKVLVIDLDPQANCTSGLGLPPSEVPHSIYEVLTQPKKFVIYQLEDVIIHTQWEGLDVVPSHINLAGAELELVNKLGREALLKKALRPVIDMYDYIIMDTPPSLSLLTVNALTSVQEVMISMRAEPWSLDGIENLMETIDIVREDLNPEIALTGVLVCMVEPHTKMAREIFRRLESNSRLKEYILSTTVRRNVKLSQCADAGMPVIHFDPSCHGAWAYRRAARELMVRGGEASINDFPELREKNNDMIESTDGAAVADTTTEAEYGDRRETTETITGGQTGEHERETETREEPVGETSEEKKDRTPVNEVHPYAYASYWDPEE